MEFCEPSIAGSTEYRTLNTEYFFLMERNIEIFTAVNMLIIGLSHTFQPGVWVDFFKVLRSYGKAGAFANGFLSLTFGSIIVAFHWVWEGAIPSIVTAVGVAQVIKSFVAFCLPAVALRSMSRPAAENPWSYRVGGILFIVQGGVVLWSVLA